MQHPELKIEWTASIGTKWQIVIPKWVRERLDLKPWTDVIVLSIFHATLLIKSENLTKMITHFQKMTEFFKEK